jgi:UDP:flavonoid glycosyltransferase YjiC (YdhE family)
MRPWIPVSNERLLQSDGIALAAINAVLERFDQPELRYVAELFMVAEDALLTFPELDHYAARGPAKYWGTLPAAVAVAPSWPAVNGPKVFAYLRPESAHFEFALQCLTELPASVLVFAPGLSDIQSQKFSRPHLHFSTEPVDLTTVAREADGALTYASPAATIAFLMAGKPAVMIPGHLEQYLFAKRVEDMGAGLLVNPEQPPTPLPSMLHRLLNDPGLRANAVAFARKYANFDQHQVMTHIVERVEKIARGTS